MQLFENDDLFDSSTFDLDAAERPLPLNEVMQVMAKNDLSFDDGRYQMVLTKMAEMGVDASGLPVDSKLVTFGNEPAKFVAFGKHVDEDYSHQALSTPKLDLGPFKAHRYLGILQPPWAWSFAAQLMSLVVLVIVTAHVVGAVLWQRDPMLDNFMCQPSAKASAWTRWICGQMAPHASILLQDSSVSQLPTAKLQV